jgi:hypothetical protein
MDQVEGGGDPFQGGVEGLGLQGVGRHYLDLLVPGKAAERRQPSDHAPHPVPSCQQLGDEPPPRYPVAPVTSTLAAVARSSSDGKGATEDLPGQG